MEVCACPNIPLRPWSSSDFTCGVSGDHRRRIEYISSVVSAVLSNLFFAILICLFVLGFSTWGSSRNPATMSPHVSSTLHRKVAF
ncbi:hypothetical protein RHMOL_Rhmol07G0315400 [Rhododendron molle]|uniref:Uncharacterized protein n=1 Tax=Rhododendron molle TaxID=49168 RepID=A0ACC0N6S8_RHOML|nr:hypothetical protein RHMOL_Rhmol07G0315400 [Rhododendron molle]